MNPDPRSIRKRMDDLEKTGDFCSPLHVSPLDLHQLKSFLFKKADKRALFGPLFGQQPSDEETES